MTSRHLDDIDKAVHLGRRAALAGAVRDEGALTRFLYRQWWLGRAAPPLPRPGAPVPRQQQRDAGATPWRTWSPLWSEDLQAGSADLVRVYLACAPHTTLHAVATVTAQARTWSRPWLLSSRALGQAVPTPDATVLYVPADALDDLHEPMARLVDELRPFLAGVVPLLTLRVARGVALAQNPVDGSSFGEHRCGLIARSVLDHLRAPHRDAVHRTYSAFLDAHVDPRRPYRELDAAWEWDRRAEAA